MKKIIQIVGVVIIALVGAVWVSQGSNTGWTKTEKEIVEVDEITGIEFTRYEKALSLGVEFLLTGTTVGIVVLGSSFLVKTNNKKTLS